ncbi:MAG: GIY-YIG nuclease family protein, partial [Bacteroidetes bacterium]|nr:GIY-YIG nuclease family protein [Bacteroidota bacterium]
LEEVSRREMVHYTGVYFLFGTDEDGSKLVVYIGEGEDCFKRIQEHNRKKDFWTYCIVVTTKTNEYTKTDVKYLEHHCLGQAEKVGRFKTENGKDSQRPSVPETREHDLLDNFETIKILLATLGYPLFEELRKTKSDKETLYCKGKVASAQGDMVDDGFIVYKDSKANIVETATAGIWVTGTRKKLIDSKILVEEGGVLVFTEDYIFGSASTAAASVLGRRANGWTEWKNKEGKTINELFRK